MTPHRRAISESFLSHLSPGLEPKGDYPGVPPLAMSRSYRDAAAARLPISAASAVDGETGSRHGSDGNPVLNVQTDNVKQSVPEQFTPVTPDRQIRIIDDGGGIWTIVKPRSHRGSRTSAESGRTSSAHNKGHRE